MWVTLNEEGGGLKIRCALGESYAKILISGVRGGVSGKYLSGECMLYGLDVEKYVDETT